LIDEDLMISANGNLVARQQCLDVLWLAAIGRSLAVMEIGPTQATLGRDGQFANYCAGGDLALLF
jgi:hypothetical protein